MQGRINRRGCSKGKHFFGGDIDVCKGEQRFWLYMILSIYYIIVLQIISLHWNTLIYAL